MLALSYECSWLEPQGKFSIVGSHSNHNILLARAVLQDLAAFEAAYSLAHLLSDVEPGIRSSGAAFPAMLCSCIAQIVLQLRCSGCGGRNSCDATRLKHGHPIASLVRTVSPCSCCLALQSGSQGSCSSLNCCSCRLHCCLEALNASLMKITAAVFQLLCSASPFICNCKKALKLLGIPPKAKITHPTQQWTSLSSLTHPALLRAISAKQLVLEAASYSPLDFPHDGSMAQALWQWLRGWII
mmetsp:Transcript_11638/g.26317  ORF Transcript_11638/g.26317 Transcript_11638/m.26317 type:complete len:242 (-) Transcript_11638:252-977(-)